MKFSVPSSLHSLSPSIILFSLSVPGGTPGNKLATGTHTHTHTCTHYYTPSPGWPCIDDPSRCLQSCRKLRMCTTISLTIATHCSWNTALMKCRREPCFRHLLLWEREMKKCFWFHSLGRSDECLLTPRYRGVCGNVCSQERSRSTGYQRDNLNAGPIILMSPFRKTYNNTWIYVSVKEVHSWFDLIADTELDFLKI